MSLTTCLGFEGDEISRFNLTTHDLLVIEQASQCLAYETVAFDEAP